MKTNFLFPYRLKVSSGILFSIALLLMAFLYIFDKFESFAIKAKVFAIIGDTEFLGDTLKFFWIENNIIDEILMLFIIAFGVIFAFSKEKHEDEMVSAIRLNSLAWATIINYGIVLLGYLFVYGLIFLNVLMAAVISQLLIFIILFRYRIYRFYKTAAHEE